MQSIANRIGDMMSLNIRNSLIALIVLSSVSYSGFGQLPEVQIINNYSYIMGGIGEHEADAIQAVAKKWPLSIQFTEHLENYDSWVSGVELKIINSAGHTIFDERIDGPMFLANLPTGSYQLIGSYRGVTKKMMVKIMTNQSLQISMNWLIAKPQSFQFENKLINAVDFNKSAYQTQEGFKKIQFQVDKIRRTTDFQQRQKMINDHLVTIQSNSRMMQKILGQEFIACCSQGRYIGDMEDIW